MAPLKELLKQTVKEPLKEPYRSLKGTLTGTWSLSWLRSLEGFGGLRLHGVVWGLWLGFRV